MTGAESEMFTRRVAVLDNAIAQRTAATSSDARARATLQWLQALRDVLAVIPTHRAAQPQHRRWTDTHEQWIEYDEIGGQWRIEREILTQAHKDHARSAVADDIAWLAVMNGLGGECEGSVACYAFGLNVLYGDYLRASPRGAHRHEAFESIASALEMVAMDIFARPDAASFFNPQTECDALLQSMRPLHAAVIGANGTKTETMTLIDRVIGKCPEP
jgi:hypothetical protein